MAARDYHFLTHWRVPGTLDEVFDVLGDSAALSRWWPSIPLLVFAPWFCFDIVRLYQNSISSLR